MFRPLSTLAVPRNRATLFMRTWQNETNLNSIRRLAKNRYISTKSSSPEAPASAHPASFLNVQIPSISQLDPQPLVQIPYVPDFWNSSSPPIEPVAKDTLPKLFMVAGAETHHGGGPSHNLLDISSGSLGSVIAESSNGRRKERGLWDDMADDVGLPPSKDVKKAIWKLFS